MENENKGKGGAATYPLRGTVAPIEERITNPVMFIEELVQLHKHEPNVLTEKIIEYLPHLKSLDEMVLGQVTALEDKIADLEQEEKRLLPVPEHQREELNKVLHFFMKNHDRRAKKISISFQHKRFSDNTGFVIIDVQNPYFMDSLARVLKETVEKCV